MTDFIPFKAIAQVRFLTLLVVLAVLGQGSRAIAHGVKINYQSTQALEVQANYDSGEPMANAQVTVYAPSSSEPWLKGTTDDKGRFTFSPDATKSGNWEIKVRQAGHGGIVNIPVNEQGAVSLQQGNAGNTPTQTAVMAASVIWGFVGTALFFARRK
jgi:nickel transport protein